MEVLASKFDYVGGVLRRYVCEAIFAGVRTVISSEPHFMREIFQSLSNFPFLEKLVYLVDQLSVLGA
jgi:predicted translin family RNA/ssDNA-binding protein